MSVQKPLILRNRQFGLLWVGQVFSQAGTRIYQIATLWWLLAQNPGHAGTAMGVFMVLCALPAILLLKKIGTTIDSSSSKKVLVTADVLATLTTVAMVFSLHFHLFVVASVYVTGLLLSLFQAFIDPTLNKAIPELTTKEETEAGVAFIASTQSISNFGGALLGAVFIGQFGMEGAVILNCVSFAVSAAANLAIKFKNLDVKTAAAAMPATSDESTSAEQATASAIAPSNAASELKDLGEGEGLFHGRPFLKTILLAFGLVNFFSTPLFIIMPAYTSIVFHLGPQWLAIFEACLWLGLVVGTFSGAMWSSHPNIVRLGSYLLGLCGICLALPGLFVTPYLYPVFLFTAAWAVGLNNVKFITLFQNIVEDKMKGRFFATLGALVGFMFPVSYFVFGLLIDHVKLTSLSLIQGAGVCALALWLFLKSDTPLIAEVESGLDGRAENDQRADREQPKIPLAGES